MAIQILSIASGMKLIKDYLDNTAEKSATDKFLNGNFKKTGSITKLLKTLVVEPTILVSEEARNSKAFDSVVSASLDIFSSFYLQAFQILTQINGKSAVEAIDILSTNNYKTSSLLKIAASKAASPALAYAADAMDYDLSTESLKVPTTLNEIDFMSPRFYLNQEDVETSKLVIKDKKLDENLSGACVKTIELTITKNSESGSESIKIPITIVGTVKVVSQRELLKVVEDKSSKENFIARWYAYRSGSISLSDFLFCSDLIKEYKKNRLDKAGALLGSLAEQKTSAWVRQKLAGVAGAEASYNTVILSELDAEYISKAFKKNITSFNGKQDYLNLMNAHNLSILDEDNERCKIYISDLQNSIDVGYNKLMKSGNKDNNAMLEMMKYLFSNKTPTF